jgi:hypothetical protein
MRRPSESGLSCFNRFTCGSLEPWPPWSSPTIGKPNSVPPFPSFGVRDTKPQTVMRKSVSVNHPSGSVMTPTRLPSRDVPFLLEPHVALPWWAAEPRTLQILRR